VLVGDTDLERDAAFGRGDPPSPPTKKQHREEWGDNSREVAA
jgi:hypothetical protein